MDDKRGPGVDKGLGTATETEKEVRCKAAECKERKAYQIARRNREVSTYSFFCVCVFFKGLFLCLFLRRCLRILLRVRTFVELSFLGLLEETAQVIQMVCVVRTEEGHGTLENGDLDSGQKLAKNTLAVLAVD